MGEIISWDFSDTLSLFSSAFELSASLLVLMMLVFKIYCIDGKFAKVAVTKSPPAVNTVVRYNCFESLRCV